MKKRSWIWEYFEKIDTKKKTSEKGESLKRCKVLDANENKYKTYYINDGSTENAINHLSNDHEITNEGKKNVSIFF